MAAQLKLPAGMRTAGVLAVGLPALLHRMTREQRQDGTFSAATACGIWAAWALYARLLLVRSRRDRSHHTLTLPAESVPIGVALAGTGTALFTAAALRFQSVRQLSGVTADDLITDGAYRYSRHPQYLGIQLAATGAALIERSLPALLIAGAGSAVLHRWSQIEEETLEARFADGYRAYQDRTARWIGTDRLQPRNQASGDGHGHGEDPADCHHRKTS